MRRRYGWVPDASPSEHTGLWRAHMHTRIPLEHIIYKPSVADQGDTNSCVAHAICAGIRARACASGGLEAAPLSVRALYLWARQRHWSTSDVDGGTRISAAIEVLRTRGCPLEILWPWKVEAEALNAPVPHKIVRSAKAVGERLATLSFARVTKPSRSALSTAIAENHPVVAAAWVDQEFNACDSWRPLKLEGLPIGGHAFVLIGYDEHGVIVQNSWGIPWGVNGRARISWRAAREQLRDVYAVGENA